ncbi:hypothetical protein MKL26_05635 [Streptococcus suis]|nr:hypothetical protein [Streptococcus suis]
MAFFKISLTSPLGNMMHILSGLGPAIGTCCCLEDRSWIAIKNFLFHSKKNGWKYLLCFPLLYILMIIVASRKASGLIDIKSLPMLFIQSCIIGGGNEEAG